MGLLKLLTVSLVAFSILYARRDEILGLAALDPSQIAAFVVDIVLWTCFKIALAHPRLGRTQITATSAGVTNAISA